ncbi:MAG: 1,4-dihydroxy-2-naphthoate octaprenyltransferase [Candidatus Heimdallarchaeota archaeon LC_3]|nr:MAG: 1,4-dihydroxy-2-naphthoate octaprenyltransferase [Candidatus Heimdallarchaeota archaeon LC_3]
MANPTSSTDSSTATQTNLPSLKNVSMKKSIRVVLSTCNFPEGQEKPDFISKWLVIMRSCVFSMTIFSGIIGGMFAIFTALTAGTDILTLNWFNFLLGVIAITLSHATNNMLNDYFDLREGVDDNEYVRALYAPHPVLSGLISKTKLLIVVTLLVVIFLAITLYFFFTGYELAITFAIFGFFLSWAYVAPPFNFKKRGLGELSVLLVWGPLMTGVVYYVTIGKIDVFILLATLPYAITVTTVLFGKHIDKILPDKEKKIYTFPVIIGEKLARRVTQVLMISFYPLIFLLLWFQTVGIGVLLIVFALPTLYKSLKVYNKPKPDDSKEKWTGWPLYFVGWSFYHSRAAGGLFILGLFVNIILGMVAPDFLFLQDILGI